MKSFDLELPPLPSPVKKAVYATSANTKSVRDGVEMGGYEKEPPLFDDAQMHEYALAAIEADRKCRGEPVGWQFYHDGKWWPGDDRIKDHRKNTEEAGFRVRDVYASPQPAAVDEAKETDLWRCTVCGRVGTVGRCCGEETREPFWPTADQFIATFRCENNGIVGTTDAKVHSVSRHDDGVIEVMIDHWPEQHGPDYTFTEAMKVCEEGLREWREKPHNKRWWNRIDGTPIPNDLLCCIAEAFAAPQPAEQQPDVSALVEALEVMVKTHDEGGWPTAAITIAKAALAAYHKGSES